MIDKNIVSSYLDLIHSINMKVDECDLNHKFELMDSYLKLVVKTKKDLNNYIKNGV